MLQPHLHRVEPALLCISCSDTEEDVDEFTLSDRVAFRNPPDLSLSNHMHGLITFDGSPGCLYRPEAEACRNPFLMKRWSCSMILFRYGDVRH